MIMDPFTHKVLRDFWKKNGDQGGVIDGGVSELFTYDVERTETYEDYVDKFNDEPEEPWSENGVPYKIGDHICEPFRFKNGEAKWPTCSSNIDGFHNGGELPGMVRVCYMTYFQDHEWYNNLMDGYLKDEALEQKVIYEESWGDAKQSVINFYGWNYIRGPYANYYNNFLDKNEHEDEERCEQFNDQERPVCNIRRFKMIMYTFEDDGKYVAIKEDEYDDLTSTSKEACRAYQEIFRKIDEGWMVTRDGMVKEAEEKV
nr:hypothetical protein [Tanacetum cinerariifolium]